ncbi:MAG: hypothetical protein WCQ95_12250 [Bacteroidota bacterium]
MQAWFDGLTTFEKIFWYIAVPFTLIFVIQLLLSVAGLDGRKNKIQPTPPDEVSDEQQPKNNRILTLGLSFFSLRNVITFFTFFGWTGVITFRYGMTHQQSLLSALACGLFAMLVLTFLFYFSNKSKST